MPDASGAPSPSAHSAPSSASEARRSAAACRAEVTTPVSYTHRLLDITLVLDLDLGAAGDERVGQLAPLQRAELRQRDARPAQQLGLADTAHGRLVAVRRQQRVARAAFGQRLGAQAGNLRLHRSLLGQERVPARVVDQPQLAAARRQTRRGVVLPQQQPVFTARGHDCLLYTSTEGGRFYGEIGKMVLLIVGVRIVSLLVSLVNGIISAKVAAELVYDLKKTIFNAISSLSLSFFSNRQTGGLMTQVNNDATTIYWFCLLYTSRLSDRRRRAQIQQRTQQKPLSVRIGRQRRRAGGRPFPQQRRKQKAPSLILRHARIPPFLPDRRRLRRRKSPPSYPNNSARCTTDTASASRP